MVEGSHADLQDRVGNIIGIAKHILRRNAKNRDALGFEPFRARVIPLGPIAKVVCSAVDLDRQLRRRAIEVEYVCSDRMLTPDAHIRTAEADPEKLLRQ